MASLKKSHNHGSGRLWREAKQTLMLLVRMGEAASWIFDMFAAQIAFDQGLDVADVLGDLPRMHAIIYKVLAFTIGRKIELRRWLSFPMFCNQLLLKLWGVVAMALFAGFLLEGKDPWLVAQSGHHPSVVEVRRGGGTRRAWSLWATFNSGKAQASLSTSGLLTFASWRPW